MVDMKREYRAYPPAVVKHGLMETRGGKVHSSNRKRKGRVIFSHEKNKKKNNTDRRALRPHPPRRSLVGFFGEDV